MSDLYDSLDDDKDEHKPSTYSLDRRKTESPNSVRRTGEGDSANKYSFFLNNNIDKKKPNLLHLFQCSEAYPQAKITLPKIQNDGPKSMSKIIVDNKNLVEQGLQWNNDGSITKSPRETSEELPFITREYRNLQFQKKKTYTLNKKIPVVHSQRKKMLSLLDPTDNQSKDDYNLTDSMKEKLLQTGSRINEKKGRECTKAKRELNTEKNENSQQHKNSNVARKKLQNLENFNAHELTNKKNKLKNAAEKISKYKSDVMLNAVKLRLNYSERRQLESGFNPFFLRQEKKKAPSDTTRSNFGDSEICELPEVSSRVLSIDNLGLEEEEMFYKELIEKERTLKQTHRTSRSESPPELLKTGTNSYKSQKEISGRSILKKKSIFIDIPTEGNTSLNSPKKCSHYCSMNSSPNVSKVELALKARTYGYLANARNIFKLKAQSEGKYNTEVRERNEKTNKKMCGSSKNSPVASCKLTKHNSLPVSGFPTVKAELVRKSHHFPRATVSLCRTRQSETSDESHKLFVLPQVNGAELKNRKMNKRLFERINSCLVSPKV